MALRDARRTPHESNYSKDGSRIFHASIGRIFTPTDPSQFCPFSDPTKGDQRFEIVDNQSFQILKSWDIGQKLREAGFSCMSSAVRPMAISPDETTAYLQISFFHGYVVFDLVHGVVRQVVSLPESEQSQQTPKSQYVLNSATTAWPSTLRAPRRPPARVRVGRVSAAPWLPGTDRPRGAGQVPT